ncbi:MAG: hypothetical protein VB013_06230 [Anaerolineaceae bacterium]|nr:hypothetical protein [Anaerolineaceae bacterium]
MIKLNKEEYELIKHLIETSYQDLRSEIRHTDNFQFKRSLKNQEEILRNIQEKLLDMNLPEELQVQLTN